MQRANHQSQPLQKSQLPALNSKKNKLFEILWLNLLTSSKGGIENEKCLCRKKTTQKMKSQTDINRPMACLMCSRQMLLFK